MTKVCYIFDVNKVFLYFLDTECIVNQLVVIISQTS